MTIRIKIFKPAIASALLLVGCATNIRMVPVSGSRADGVIAMSADVGAFQKPVVDWEDARATAANRCAAWGYSGAQAFGSVQRQCVAATDMGCATFRYTVMYQCSGGR